MIIKEKKVDIIEKNDREVINQIIKIIVQDNPGNSVHIMSDNIKSIYLQRCIIASEFRMDIYNHYLFIYMQDCFTKELINQLKIILEKITPVDFDITLFIGNCIKIQQVHFTNLIDLVTIIKKRSSDHLENIIHIFMKGHIIVSHQREHLNLEKDIVIIKFCTLHSLGHLAQRGHQSPTIIKLDFPASIKMDIIDFEYHIIDFSSISGPNYLSITTAINLDIIVKAERFITFIHLSYINHLNMSDIIKSEQFVEHHLLDHISISRFSHISVIDIKTELSINDIFAEYHLLDYTSISGPNYISVPSAINIGIYIKADRFIRAICPSSINLLVSKDIDIKTKMFIKNINVEPCLPHQGILNAINHFFVTSSFNMSIIVEKEENIRKIRISNIHLLGNIDINIKAERFIRTFHPSYISLIKGISREVPSGHHQQISKSHQGSIIGISYLFVTSSLNMSIFVEKKKFIKNIVTSYLNLLYMDKSSTPWDLSHQKDLISVFTVIDNIRTDRFIRTFHSSNNYPVNGIYREAPSGDHQQTLKSHHGASSMNTSEEHIVYMQDIMVEPKGQDIQTYCIYLTIFSVFISKYFVISESIIDNYFHIILEASYQWEAFCITHSCPSRNGTSRSHYIEWRDICIFIVYLNSFRHHLITWNEVNYNIIKNIYIMDIIHQKSAYFIYNFYIKAAQRHLVINDIKEAQSSYNFTQGISLIDTIIYDINFYHTSIYDAFGIIIVEGIGLSSMTRESSIIGFIDSRKRPSEDIVIILNIHYNIDFHFEHIIHHLESYNTFNIPNYSAFNIKFSISYLNQFIIELYSTTIETNAIRNVTIGMTSYMGIKICELYITTGNTDISVCITVGIVEFINSILETIPIITVEGEKKETTSSREIQRRLESTSLQGSSTIE